MGINGRKTPDGMSADVFIRKVEDNMRAKPIKCKKKSGAIRKGGAAF